MALAVFLYLVKEVRWPCVLFTSSRRCGGPVFLYLRCILCVSAVRAYVCMCQGVHKGRSDSTSCVSIRGSFLVHD